MLGNACLGILLYLTSITGQDIACEPREFWSWTPWFNFHRPSSKGEYELHAAIRSRHPTIVCAEPRGVSAVNQAGVDMNRTLDMILLRAYDVFCLNSYDPKFQRKMCDDYSVRYCCPTGRRAAIMTTTAAATTTSTPTTTSTTTSTTTTSITTVPSTTTSTPRREIFATNTQRTYPFLAVENPSRVVQLTCGRTARSAAFHSTIRTNFFMNFFHSMMSRIINGAESRPNGWPWLVSIGIRYRGHNGLWQNRTHICGGTLIEPSHVLTAAHCLEQKIDDRSVPLTPTNPTLESFFIVRIGIHDIRLARADELYRARRIFIHERFVSSTFENDIAIIRLDRPVPNSQYAVPICLPSNHVQPGAQVTVAGWGTIAESSRVHSDVLRQAFVNILPAANCRVYTDVHFDTSKQLCAASPDWSKDTWSVVCSRLSWKRWTSVLPFFFRLLSSAGDSGGPLMYQENGEWTIGGITSYGFGCSKRGFPGVYVRTVPYLTWIKQKMLSTY